MAAQTFIRWSRLGVWERLLILAQERGVQLGLTFLDGTCVRAHQKAAGAAAKGGMRPVGAAAMRVWRLVRRDRDPMAAGQGRRWREVQSRHSEAHPVKAALPIRRPWAIRICWRRAMASPTRVGSRPAS